MQQPAQVFWARQVVAGKGDDHHHQRHGEHRPGKVVCILQGKAEPAKQSGANHRQDEKLTKSHHQPRDGQNTKSDGVGPVGGALKGGKALNLAASLGAMQEHAAPAPVINSDSAERNQDERTTVRDDPVVAYLAPGLSCAGQARARVLHKGLDQVASLGGRQATVARGASTNLTPHGRVVAGLHLVALTIGLFVVAGFGTGVWLDIHDVLAFHTQGICRCRRWRR